MKLNKIRRPLLILYLYNMSIRKDEVSFFLKKRVSKHKPFFYFIMSHMRNYQRTVFPFLTAQYFG